MNRWGVSVYGDPCRQCGFRWSTGLEGARAHVAGLPAVYGGILAGATGTERHPDLTWSVGEYVCHVADNLRIWAERLMGVAGEDRRWWVATTRPPWPRPATTRASPWPRRLWSLDRSVADWLDAVDRSDSAGVVLIHPDRGGQTLADVVVSNAHDAEHHRWDIERSLR